ncbi:helix-turn-helix transcriptional regulator [Pseudomonas sp. 1912-s]|uniref:helix-turn-helix transcriptional regulator n=1 Tax=Pseudomonas sp. 1912-s TaxID=3033802 RepID=UPI0023DE8841|nr:helix-turn-helix transcriptional regulator [Pseudomonas sp. 1912-s]MDF3197573.1 helix-turn-helix transcriptional regulator [Pseudomonas sp. 1912-s]
MEIVTCGSLFGKLGSVLAERELRCLLAIANGGTDKEIAKRDGVSPRSVKGRIESVMYKLGVFKRPSLVAEAIRLGLIGFCCNMNPAPQHHNQPPHDGVFLA